MVTSLSPRTSTIHRARLTLESRGIGNTPAPAVRLDWPAWMRRRLAEAVFLVLASLSVVFLLMGLTPVLFVVFAMLVIPVFPMLVLLFASLAADDIVVMEAYHSSKSNDAVDSAA